MGWTFSGRDNKVNQDESKHTYYVCECSQEKEKLDVLINEFHTTEAFDIAVQGTKLKDTSDEIAINILRESLKFKKRAILRGVVVQNARYRVVC